MFERRRFRCCWVLIAASLFCSGIVYIGYFCSEGICAFAGLTSPRTPNRSQSQLDIQGQLLRQTFRDDDLKRDFSDFDIEGTSDVIVFLHIQKTGGTSFGRHLVRNIDLQTPCTCYKGRKRCDCENKKRHIWLFSRYSTGWQCGLHADWTELQNCVSDYLDSKEGPADRRYLYITILRDPYHRYLSEWKHVQRGSTWLAARLKCNGRQASLEEMPFCFHGENWSGVTLEEFLTCPHNLANNRQTRMLANLSVVGCYNLTAIPSEQRNALMLQSAKENLKNMAFFGLTEFQKDTQFMFERTFHMEFLEDFVQYNNTHADKASELSASQKQGILDANSLDIELYRYAKELFMQRLSRMKQQDQIGNYRKQTHAAAAADANEYREGDENYEDAEEES